MSKEDEHIKRQVPLQIVILISVFIFLGGAGGGILFCGYYAHEPLRRISGVAVKQPYTLQMEQLEEKVKMNFAKAETFIQLGNLYADTDQFEKAIFAYEEALKRDPQNANVLIDLGILNRLIGQPVKAIATFERAITVEPKNESARLYKGIVLLDDLNDLESAIQALEALLEINPLAMVWEDQSVLELVQQYRSEEQSSKKGNEL